MLVHEIMSKPVVVVEPGTSVREARSLLARNHLHDLPVVEDRVVMGMVSEIDLIRFAVPGDPRSSAASRQVGATPAHAAATVRQVMSAVPYVTRPGADVSDVVRTFDLMRWKSLPVVEDGELVGIITRADVVRALAATADGALLLPDRSE